MSKVLWLRFEHCLDPFTMLLFERSSEMRLFRHLSKKVFRVRNFENTAAMRAIFFLKILKILSTFEKYQKKKTWEKVFPFRDYCISVGYVKLSIRKTILLISSQCLKKESWDFAYSKRNLFELNCLHNDQQIWEK